MAAPLRATSGLGENGRPSRLLALSHPAFLAGVALLAVNDAVLKPTFHSWWTGKLSDLAGVFVVAVVVGITTRRPWTADVLTAAGFAAIKLSPVAAGLVAPFLGGVTRQDATDLLALVALVPAHRFVSRRIQPKEDGRPWQVPLTAAALSLTVLSVSATSCPDLARGVTDFAVVGDEVVAFDASDVRPPDEADDLDEPAPPDPTSTPSSFASSTTTPTTPPATSRPPRELTS